MSGFGARLRRLFSRSTKPEPDLIAAKISARVKRVAESLLDNERLTSDLDDSAAKELLDWGLSIARQIAQGTADVDDDEQAEQAMYPRLRATRRMMRAVNLWIVNQREGDIEGRDRAFDNIVEQASIIYGRPFEAIADAPRAVSFGTQPQSAGDPPQMIAQLRQLFERPDDVPNEPQGDQ
jgi:hypothetical protein